ncbi:MAG: RlmI/RlmK family 23S rRNA methyltransferase [Flammeovirgaceae bacterium]|nr:RlmI/RlmK family 23S rRNA methyltransferase [Flammeovirgaceae bacterium]MBE62953.1 RlmI/RlmK family 23S rRNA methyltransferase [Flammeovirgaceae bacterium]MBR08813.1 RlmI/RlmK family 23S rRNA methyltransferase [Rickettsiales bacterium]HCX20796.1 RlmI/RlmK family 23S rRNA methyltransferase [Cytophagales bacterium]
MKTIALKPGKERSLERRHPWVFSGALNLQEQIADGELVRVTNKKGRFLGIGHFQNASIAVRIISFEDRAIDHSFWVETISDAKATRARLSLPNESTDIYRLVHGEGDQLTGLIIDVYGNTAVIQPHSQGMYLQAKEISEALKEVLGDSLKTCILKHPSHVKDDSAEVLFGETKEIYLAKEWGVTFQLDLLYGQKTGFFVDQRENRRRLGEYSKGKKVLNTFCYNGGFSLCALNAGAEKVVSIDVSKSAIEQTKENLKLNGYDPEVHECIAMDTFDYMQQNEQDFDVIVLDPPAFAKHMSARHNALKGYTRLNAMALRQIKPGGILFTFSCSQVVDKTLFYNAIVAAAIQAGRTVKVLERLSQPGDHPVSIFHPEGEYLKGLILEVW